MTVVGCVIGPPTPPPPFPTSITNSLPTPAPGSLAIAGCSIVELDDAELAGGLDDTGVQLLVWLDSPGGRIELVWPPGFGIRTYRFGTRNFDIVDLNGAVLYTEGDMIDRACLAGPREDPRAVVLLPPAP
jgi:hypothetical protein